MNTPEPSYREIKLTKGQVALIDGVDYESISAHNWWTKKAKNGDSYYAVREDSDGKTVWMHREILGLKFGDPRIGDYREPALTLDNRRSNLRIATPVESACNRRRNSLNTSGFKGVSFEPSRNKWRASIKIRGKKTILGRFKTPEKAYEAYCAASRLLHGEFGRVA